MSSTTDTGKTPPRGRLGLNVVHWVVAVILLLGLTWAQTSKNRWAEEQSSTTATESAPQSPSKKVNERATETMVKDEMVELGPHENVCRDITGYSLGKKTGVYKEMPVRRVLTYADGEVLTIEPEIGHRKIKHKRLKTLCYENLTANPARARLQLVLS